MIFRNMRTAMKDSKLQITLMKKAITLMRTIKISWTNSKRIWKLLLIINFQNLLKGRPFDIFALFFFLTRSFIFRIFQFWYSFFFIINYFLAMIKKFFRNERILQGCHFLNLSQVFKKCLWIIIFELFYLFWEILRKWFFG